MTGTTRALMQAWCLAVILFGTVLALAAFPATDGIARAILAIMGGGEVPMTDALRFAVGLMGAVTMGWGFTMLAVANASAALDAVVARPLWRGIGLAFAAWYVIDSVISVRTGFALNAVSNSILFAAFLAIAARAGAFRRA